MSERPPTSALLRDRADAGKRLAERLLPIRAEHPVVLALPRGGVPVAYEIARQLDAPLDILIVRKVGAPGNPEYGLGALAEGGIRWIDEPRVREAGFRLSDLEPIIAREKLEIRRRAEVYRGGRPPADVRGRSVILVDDGVATGGTLRAAIRTVRARAPSRLTVALGVAPHDTFRQLEQEADKVVALLVPEVFFAVGEWYQRFDQVTDEEVERLLSLGSAPLPASA